jgi:hypothetical protein
VKWANRDVITFTAEAVWAARMLSNESLATKRGEKSTLCGMPAAHKISRSPENAIARRGPRGEQSQYRIAVISLTFPDGQIIWKDEFGKKSSSKSFREGADSKKQNIPHGGMR